MTTRRMKSAEVRSQWREVLTAVERGETVVIEHYNRPVAVLQPWTEDSQPDTEAE